MPLSSEFRDFYRRWTEKASKHGAANLSDYFDKYFSLFVAFNRLYAEATFILARQGEPKLEKRKSFPDADAAKTYVLKYLGSKYYLQMLEADQEVKQAIKEIKDLIRSHNFCIKLDMVKGNRQPEKDEELLKQLESGGFNPRAKAILDMLYSVRCNMFHGHKGFQEVQVALLKPLSCILKATVEILYEKLERDDCWRAVAADRQ